MVCFPHPVVPQPVYSNMAEICGSVGSGSYMQVSSGSEAVEPERPTSSLTAGNKGPVSTPSPESKSSSEGKEQNACVYSAWKNDDTTYSGAC